MQSVKYTTILNLFVRLDEHTFYTELGYKEFLDSQAKKQLQRCNEQKNYNGAWRY